MDFHQNLPRDKPLVLRLEVPAVGPSEVFHHLEHFPIEISRLELLFMQRVRTLQLEHAIFHLENALVLRHAGHPEKGGRPKLAPLLYSEW